MFIKPVIGTRKVPDIIRTDIAKLHHDLRDKPYQANRTLGVLSVVFNQCKIWGLRPDGSNPCRGNTPEKEWSSEVEFSHNVYEGDSDEEITIHG